MQILENRTFKFSQRITHFVDIQKHWVHLVLILPIYIRCIMPAVISASATERKTQQQFSVKVQKQGYILM